MCRHASRRTYYIADEGIVKERPFLGLAAAEPPHNGPAPEPPLFKFGRMFEQPIKSLIDLAGSMKAASSQDSAIFSGYTYLGQFIAHEITYDKTQDLPVPQPIPPSFRSPQLELDSLYGNGPLDETSKNLYDENDSALLKIGKTLGTSSLSEF